jgi:hypothetical protein
MAKKRQTFSKMLRDRELKERRELKQEKKQAARLAKKLGLEAPDTPPEPDSDAA